MSSNQENDSWRFRDGSRNALTILSYNFGSLHGFETSTVDSYAQFGDGDLLLVVLYPSLFLLEADFHIFETLCGFSSSSGLRQRSYRNAFLLRGLSRRGYSGNRHAGKIKSERK